MPIVSTPGEVDICNAPLLGDALVAATANATRVIVDMTATSHCAASGFNVTIPTGEMLRSNGRELQLVCTTPVVLRLIDALQARQVCRIFASLSEALAANDGRA